MTTKKQTNQNVQKLLNSGVNQEFIDLYRQSMKEQLDKKEMNTILNAWNTQQNEQNARRAALDPRIPDELRNDPSFQSLSVDKQEIAVYNYELTLANDAVKAKALSDALEQATSQADPYWKEVIRIAQDELTRGITGLEETFESKEQSLQKKIGEINEDLTYNRDFLTTSEQAELSKQLDTYQQELTGIREQAGKSGLTSSSIRTDAEQLSAKNNQYVVGSIQRDYAKQQRDLGVSSVRGIEDIENEVTDLKRTLGTEETGLIRDSEKYLGTENLPELNPNLSGSALGGVTGKLYEEKAQDVEARKDAIYADLISTGLNSNS